MEELEKKLDALKEYLTSLGSVAIAFSSGVDSTFLLKVAHEVLQDKAVAITVRSALFPNRESKEAEDFCKREGIKQYFIDIDELSIPGFQQNPKDRCYICKKGIFTQIKKLASELKLAWVCEGSNIDDNGDYRPGLKAVAELEIKSPLRHCNLYKNDIRILSKEFNLATWNKPSFACLASRFVYGQTITREKLLMVEKAEQLLLEKGYTQFRVRIHSFEKENLARIEILPEQFEKLMEERNEVTVQLKKLGFNYVSMDLSGYRTGSMNETLGLKV